MTRPPAAGNRGFARAVRRWKVSAGREVGRGGGGNGEGSHFHRRESYGAPAGLPQPRRTGGGHTPTPLQSASDKLLTFTDHRQNAPLQAGHFSDFVHVSRSRPARHAPLLRDHEPTFGRGADAVVRTSGLPVRKVAGNPELDGDPPAGTDVLRAFTELAGFRLYEGLRCGWWVVRPDLENKGLSSPLTPFPIRWGDGDRVPSTSSCSDVTATPPSPRPLSEPANKGRKWSCRVARAQ